MSFDCGFKKENNWFRYRAAAIIVEDKAYPTFLKEYLKSSHEEIIHIVTDESVST